MQMRWWRPLALISAMACVGGCAAQTDPPAGPALSSGLQPGDDIVPWNPIHVAGPNRGTNACPVCTYEARPAVVIFSKGGPNLPALMDRLERLVDQEQQRDLKGFIVALDTPPDPLRQMADDHKVSKIGVCYPDPDWRAEQLKAYKINPAADNTVMVYKNYKVTANFVDLSAADFGKLEAAVASLPR